MPNPLDYLKQMGSFLTTPMVPQHVTDDMADGMDSPNRFRSPMEARIQGFGAGALQGLQTLTTPLDAIGMLAGGAGEAGSIMSRMAPAALHTAEAASPYLKPLARVAEEVGPRIKQAIPTASEVEDMIGGLKYNLAKTPTGGVNTPRALGQAATRTLPAEMMAATPGAEASYNAANIGGQAVMPRLPQPGETRRLAGSMFPR